MALNKKPLTPSQQEDLFLDIFYEIAEEVYHTLWYPNIPGDQLISDLAECFPKLYRRVHDVMEERIYQMGHKP